MTEPLERRQALLERAQRTPADVLVVGGGINGVGVALDAASRGMRVLLVEADDLGSGTSSRSSKLIHGGLRYLEHYEFRLVHEALSERGRLLQLAPHLVQARRFVVPVTGSWWKTPYIGAGLTLYDLLGGRHAEPWRHLDRDELEREAPQLRLDDVRGGFSYMDGVTDDARLVVAVARTAERLGAGILTRASVEEWLRPGGRTVGVRVRDDLTGHTHDLPATVVVDATGAYEADQRDLATSGVIVPSRGSHLVLRPGTIQARTGLTIRVPDRVVFLIPWLGHWLLGTTDVAHHAPIADPRPTAAEVDYLLEVAADALREPIRRHDVVGAFAGIRPLVAPCDGAASTAAVSREHRIVTRPDGVLAVRGGKLTTYRIIAGEVVDRVADRLGRSVASATEHLPLVGAAPRSALSHMVTELTEAGLDADVAHSLVTRHGIHARDVAALASSDGLDARLLPGAPYLAGEVVWALEREHALTIDDVLSRRTRASVLDEHQAVAAAATVGALLADRLGWSPTQRAHAVDEYRDAAVQYRVPHTQEELEVVAS